MHPVRGHRIKYNSDRACKLFRSEQKNAIENLYQPGHWTILTACRGVSVRNDEPRHPA